LARRFWKFKGRVTFVNDNKLPPNNLKEETIRKRADARQQRGKRLREEQAVLFSKKQLLESRMEQTQATVPAGASTTGAISTECICALASAGLLSAGCVSNQLGAPELVTAGLVSAGVVSAGMLLLSADLKSDTKSEDVLPLLPPPQATATDTNTLVALHQDVWAQEEKVEKLCRETRPISTEQTKQVLAILEKAGFTCVQAVAEADPVLAKMSPDFTFVLTEDSDMLGLYGIENLLRQQQSDYYLYKTSEILQVLNLNLHQLQEMACLSGCDPTSGIYGVGMKTAYKFMREHGSLKAILRNLPGKYVIPEGFESRCEEILQMIRA
jgi:5'-3' exonuclease